MENLNPFNIKVKVDDDETKEISIKGENLISEVKQLVGKVQTKIDEKYLLLYKDNQLLEDNNTVSSYHITSSDILTIKSSRQGEFLIYFCEDDKKIAKYVVKEEKVFDAYQTVKRYFYRKTKWGYDENLVYMGVIIYGMETFGGLKIKEFDHILVEKDYYEG